MTDNTNAPLKIGRTPIHRAACYGHTEIVKILVPLTDNPNAPDENGTSPIHWAAHKGHTEIVKILESFKLSKKRTEAEPPQPQPTKRSRK